MNRSMYACAIEDMNAEIYYLESIEDATPEEQEEIAVEIEALYARIALYRSYMQA